MNRKTQPQTVMIVDNHLDTIYLLAEALKKAGYSIIPSTSSKKALEILKTRENKPDLIILDIKMPEMDGFELCRQIKLIPGMQSVPVLFISIANNPQLITHALAIGGDDFISKPYNTDIVLKRIADLLELKNLRSNKFINQNSENNEFIS